jgi:hypothetical protein
MTADIDHRVARSYQQENLHLAYAHNVAERYGIDISGYEQERTALEKERDAARSKGDKLGERKADALIAQNTYNTLAGETDSITNPAERKKHLEEMRDQERIVTEREAALAAQIELEARRTAAERHLSPEETDAYVTQFKQQKLAEYQERVKALHSTPGTAAAQAELKVAVIDGAAKDVPDARAAPHPVAASLKPEDHAKVQQAASTIRAGFGTSKNSVDDFDISPPASSSIKMATAPEAHTTVEVPSVGRSGGGAAPLTP